MNVNKIKLCAMDHEHLSRWIDSITFDKGKISSEMLPLIDSTFHDELIQKIRESVLSIVQNRLISIEYKIKREAEM